MRRLPLAEGLTLLTAIVVVVLADSLRWLWLTSAAASVRLGRWRRLLRLRARVARLPPGVALPLFLVPELCSRCGWIVSAWLLLGGETLLALLVYAGSKLVAGVAAVWIYQACEPALMQIRWFAALSHRMSAMGTALRSRLLPGHDGGGFGLPVAQARQWLERRRRW